MGKKIKRYDEMKNFTRSVKRMVRFLPTNLSWLFRNYSILKRICKNEYDIQNVRIYKLYDWHAGFIYFCGIYKGKRVFIKVCMGEYDTIEAEARIKDFNSMKWHPQVIAVKKTPISMIITEYVEFLKLEQVPRETIEDIVQQAVNILCDMQEIGMFHRDIRPENLGITKENRLMLFDFGWAIYLNDVRYSNAFIEKILNISYRKNNNEFDDAFSMYVSLQEMFPDVPLELWCSIKDCIGVHVLKV